MCDVWYVACWSLFRCVDSYCVKIQFVGRPFIKRFALCYRSVVCLSCPVSDVCALWPNGWTDQDETWHAGRPRPWPHCVYFDPATPRKRHSHSTQFLAHVYCGHMAGWMKTPLGMEVDLGPGHIVLDGVPAPAKGAQQPPLFLAHVYCGHGRPSQLLLSSC